MVLKISFRKWKKSRKSFALKFSEWTEILSAKWCLFNFYFLYLFDLYFLCLHDLYFLLNQMEYDRGVSFPLVFLTKWNSIWFKIKRKTVITITFQAIWKVMEIYFVSEATATWVYDCWMSTKTCTTIYIYIYIYKPISN